MSDAIAQILVKAERSIEGAEALRERGLHEFSVPRAYYAMFYAAEALLLAKGLSFSTHKAVIAAFGEHLAKPRLIDPMLHQHLIKAFEKRQVGDYAFGDIVTPEDAQLQIDRAKVFLQAARQWLRQ